MTEARHELPGPESESPPPARRLRGLELGCGTGVAGREPEQGWQELEMTQGYAQNSLKREYVGVIKGSSERALRICLRSSLGSYMSSGFIWAW